jgi:hypothetical protein
VDRTVTGKRVFSEQFTVKVNKTEGLKRVSHGYNRGVNMNFGEMETTIDRTAIIPEPEMLDQAKSCLAYANGYFATFSKSVAKENARFGADLLYQMAILSVEKYFVALLARYDWNASHHMPVALFKEALMFEPDLPDSMKQTCILVGKFEAICSIDGFGYRQPSPDDLKAMSEGIKAIKELTKNRMKIRLIR